MKSKVFGIILTCVMLSLLTACQTTSLTGQAAIGFQKYQKVGKHKALFAHQNIDGGFVWAYSQGKLSRLEAFNEAEKKCNSLFDKVNFKAKCEPYYLDDISLRPLQQHQISALLIEDPYSNSNASQSYSRELAINGTWEGHRSNVTGSIALTSDKGKGPMKLIIDDVACKGEWLYGRGKYNTDTPPEGTWAVVCSNSGSASGTYRSYKLGLGEAHGTDSHGNKIHVVFRPAEDPVVTKKRVNEVDNSAINNLKNHCYSWLGSEEIKVALNQMKELQKLPNLDEELKKSSVITSRQDLEDIINMGNVSEIDKPFFCDCYARNYYENLSEEDREFSNKIGKGNTLTSIEMSKLRGLNMRYGATSAIGCHR